MNCESARALMPELVDGASALPTEVLAHIESCSDCEAKFASLTDLDAMIAGLSESVDHSVLQNRAQLQKNLTTNAKRMLPLRPVAAMAAMLAVGIATWMIAAAKKSAPMEQLFIDIPYLAPLDSRENTTIVRMDIPVATLLAAGYRVGADPNIVVPADVLVGEDGRAHAIRVLANIAVDGPGSL